MASTILLCAVVLAVLVVTLPTISKFKKVPRALDANRSFYPKGYFRGRIGVCPTCGRSRATEKQTRCSDGQRQAHV
jgi:hypothetical protein